jgi:hypothetical protein
MNFFQGLTFVSNERLRSFKDLLFSVLQANNEKIEF